MNACKRWLADRFGIREDGYCWYRHRLCRRYFIRGEIQTLNIAPGGGTEPLRLLERGNRLTTIDLNEKNTEGTRLRVERNGFSDRHTALTGHLMEIDLKETFHQVVMCEVLEHILDDTGAIRKLASWLKPGGRLILSTPTALHGQNLGEAMYPDENDHQHVRVGYQGPELDGLLADAGLLTLKRIYNGNCISKLLMVVERLLDRTFPTRLLRYALAPLFRLGYLLVDWIPCRYYDQITVAVKR